MVPPWSAVGYTAMPAELSRDATHAGVPYTVKLADWLSLPASVVVIDALEPLGEAVLNHDDGTVASYRRVLPPRQAYDVSVRSDAPASDARTVSDALLTAEFPYASYT